MIKRFWLVRSWISFLLLPITAIYALVVFLRRLSYKLSILPSWKSPVPIVIVGNLTVGGNGKTPIVIWLVKELLSRGYCVGVVSRGYGGKASSYPVLVSNRTSIEESGDEAALIYRRTGVPVALAPQRVRAVKMLLEEKGFDFIISDDGLQHYALQRSFEIVVVDGIQRFGNGFLLPSGPLREFQYRLTTVNAVIVNSGVAQNGEISMHLSGDVAVNMLTGEKRLVNELGGEVVAVAGIGNPERFFLSLKEKKVALIATYAFSDHQNYEFSILRSLATDCQVLLMTEKDAIKCFPFSRLNWWYLPVNATISKPDTEKILSSITGLVHFDRSC